MASADQRVLPMALVRKNNADVTAVDAAYGMLEFESQVSPPCKGIFQNNHDFRNPLMSGRFLAISAEIFGFCAGVRQEEPIRMKGLDDFHDVFVKDFNKVVGRTLHLKAFPSIGTRADSNRCFISDNPYYTAKRVSMQNSFPFLKRGVFHCLEPVPRLMPVFFIRTQDGTDETSMIRTVRIELGFNRNSGMRSVQAVLFP